jgi:shikimate dehydrogenase
VTGGAVGRAAVLGSPIGHSLSPALHLAAYRKLGLDWSYEAIECDEAGLPAFLEAAGGVGGFDGLSLTMPLKRAVLPLLDHVSPLAAAVGAANTVTFGRPDPAGHRLRRGDNTDVPGMTGAIRDAPASSDPARDLSSERVLILGAGGTAAAAIGACRQLGIGRAAVVVRDRARAGDLLVAASNLEVAVELLDWPARDALTDATLVVSTVPAGAADELVAGPANLFRPAQLLFDVLYHPWPTALATAAEQVGAQVIGGLELLVRQAGVQVELMTGHLAPIDAMREAGHHALTARAG